MIVARWQSGRGAQAGFAVVGVGLFLCAHARATPPTATALAAQEPSYRALIAPKHWPEGSFSVGNAVSGRLYGGVQLPAQGDGYEVFPDCAARDTQWGTPDLVDLLTHTARTVEAASPGPPMMVCNMSQAGGGNISWSRSHNSGRDADIAFFVQSAAAPWKPPGLVPFHRDGLSFWDAGITFDVARNWQLMRALLTHPTVHVQWVFVYDPLREAMLEHAREIGESPELVQRAEEVIAQPSDAMRHHDHFHIRIFCNPAERAEGCIDREPFWPWFDQDRGPLTRRSAALAMGLRDEDPAVRARVLDEIEEIAAWDATPAIAELAIFDPDHKMRLRATNLLAQWRDGDEALTWSLEQFIRSTRGGLAQDDPAYSTTEVPASATVPMRFFLGEGRAVEPHHLGRAWRLVRKIASPAMTDFLSRALASRRALGTDDPRASTPEAWHAAQAVGHVLDLRLIPALLIAMDHDNPKIRVAANRALRRVTGYRLGVSWGDAVSQPTRTSNLARWSAWWDENKTQPREDLLWTAFRRAGVRVLGWKDPLLPEALVPLTARNDEIGYNADRVLCELTGAWTPRESSAASKHKRWLAWAAKKK